MTKAKMFVKVPPLHPGEMLNEEYLKPMGITGYRLAKDINVSAMRINQILLKKRSVSADTALRLSKYFGLPETFWMDIQARYELDVEKDKLGDRLQKEVRVLAKAS